MNNEQIIKEYWNEVDSIRRDLVENGEDGEIYRFGHKTKRGNELFTVVDWKNIESFILQVRTDTIDEIRKEVESKREEILANDAEMHSMIDSTRNMKEWEEYGIRGQNQLKDNLIRMSLLEDIKTFLNGLDR